LIRSTEFDQKLTLDALNVKPQNSDYGQVVALSILHLFGNIELTAGWNGLSHIQNGTIAFLRGAWFALY